VHEYNVYLSILSYSTFVMESILCETTSVNGNCFQMKAELFGYNWIAFARLPRGSASNESAYHSYGCQKNKTGNGHLKSMSILFCSCMEYMYADENSIHLIEFILHWNNFSKNYIYRNIFLDTICLFMNENLYILRYDSGKDINDI
jgi:hypothetical protein